VASLFSLLGNLPPIWKGHSWADGRGQFPKQPAAPVVAVAKITESNRFRFGQSEDTAKSNKIELMKMLV
jgi:hypothetical protein